MPKIAEHQFASQIVREENGGYRPVLWRCLKGYAAVDFRADLIAGIITGIVALPLSIALAIAVGAPPQAGLYTAIVGGGVAALFGGSHSQVSGPTAAFIVILAPIYAQHGPHGLLAAGLMAGGILLIMGISGLGSLIKYVPYPVTVGFTTGIGVTIATIQLKDLFGLQTTFERVSLVSHSATLDGQTGAFVVSQMEHVKGLPEHFHEKIVSLFHGFHNTPAEALLHTGLIGFLTLAVLIGYPRSLPSVARRIPAPLVGVCVAVLAVLVLGWQEVATIGSRFGGIPRGMPAFNSALFTEFTWDMAHLKPLVLPALAIAMLGAIESLLSAVVADGMAGTKHHSNSELIGQGLANVAAPLFGGIAVTGAIARTATNIRNGARTPLASLFHALFLLVVMLAAAPYAAYIPMAALAAILLVVSYNMAELKHFRHLLNAPKSDVIVLFSCFLLTVFTDMVVAVVAGMIMATILFMRRMSEITRVDLLHSVAGDKEMQSHDLDVSDIPRGVTIYSVDGPFFFGASEKAITALESADSATRIVIMRLDRVPAMDATGLYALEKVFEHLTARGTQLILSNVRPQPRLVMANAGFLDLLGAENVAADIEWALARAYEVLGPAAKNRRTGNTDRRRILRPDQR